MEGSIFLQKSGSKQKVANESATKQAPAVQ